MVRFGLLRGSAASDPSWVPGGYEVLQSRHWLCALAHMDWGYGRYTAGVRCLAMGPVSTSVYGGFREDLARKCTESCAVILHIFLVKVDSDFAGSVLPSRPCCYCRRCVFNDPDNLGRLGVCCAFRPAFQIRVFSCVAGFQGPGQPLCMRGGLGSCCDARLALQTLFFNQNLHADVFKAPFAAFQT